MPVAKLPTSGTLNAMKSDEGNDSLDTFIRQAIGKEPLLPFARTGDNPVQWIQLLHALDQPDLPGWPLMSPIKVQMQKCEKCSQEFCSPINYRRHIRVHRRSFNINKVSHKNRDLLAAFWDKLTLEEAKEVVSFNDVMLKEIPGSSVIRALAACLRKPGVWTLPQVYVKAGSTLLDVIQAKPSSVPISSQELFSILDTASERTFLCAAADSVQKYIFDGETAKSSLELKNLIASTSFLFEQQLVKAWVADKDAEALRCQKLLVEEEEAAQKRQSLLLERKKQKKLRQKEQKEKELFYRFKGDLNVTVGTADGPVLTEASGSSSPSDSSSNSVDVPANLDPLQFQSQELEEDIEAHSRECIDQGNPQANEPQMVGENGHQHLSSHHGQVSKSQRGGWYGSHVSQNHQTSTPEFVQKLCSSKDRVLLNGGKVWTKKHKMEINEESLKHTSIQGDISHNIEENNCKVVIGSISITVNNCTTQQQLCRTDDALDTCSNGEPAVHKNNVSEKLVKDEAAVHSGTHRVWRPVSRGETEGCDVMEKVHDRIVSSERCVPSQSTNDDDFDNQKHHHVLPDDGNALQGNVPFSSIAAKEFLARRWKEALAGDHVKLVLSSNPDAQERNVLGNAENRLGRSAQVKVRTKPEKNLKMQYIPKPKAVA